MICADIHTHTAFSTDSDTPMEEMIKGAIERGVKIYCITDHYDYGHHIYDHRDEPGYGYHELSREEVMGIFTCDADASFEEFKRLREKYSGKIKLLYGMELGLQPSLCGHFLEYSKKYPFDMLIGSCHEAGGKDPYYPAFIRDRDAVEAFRFYYEEMVRCVESSHEAMEVLAHPDYGLRYHRPEGFSFDYADYSDILDELWELLIRRGIALECNTGSFKYFKESPMPIEVMLRRYRELGGNMVTVASDAHSPERIGADFDRAEEILRTAGFEGYYVFENRKPEFIKF